VAKEQLHEDRSRQPTPPNIRVLTIVLGEFDGKSQDRYAKQILNYFCSVDFYGQFGRPFFIRAPDGISWLLNPGWLDARIGFAPKFFSFGEFQLRCGGISLVFGHQSEREISSCIARIMLDHFPRRGPSQFLIADSSCYFCDVL
jgi:hypothetical protein